MEGEEDQPLFRNFDCRSTGPQVRENCERNEILTRLIGICSGERYENRREPTLLLDSEHGLAAKRGTRREIISFKRRHCLLSSSFWSSRNSSRLRRVFLCFHVSRQCIYDPKRFFRSPCTFSSLQTLQGSFNFGFKYSYVVKERRR